MFNKSRARIEQAIDKQAHSILPEMIDAYQKIDRVLQMVQEQGAENEAKVLAELKDRVHDAIKNEAGRALEDMEEDIESDKHELQEDIETILFQAKQGYSNLDQALKQALGDMTQPNSLDGGYFKEGDEHLNLKKGFQKKFHEDLLLIKREWADVLQKLEKEIEALNEVREELKDE